MALRQKGCVLGLEAVDEAHEPRHLLAEGALRLVRRVGRHEGLAFGRRAEVVRDLRARVGRATFYAHFRNKHDLLLSDAERFCEMLERHFGDVPSIVVEPGVVNAEISRASTTSYLRVVPYGKDASVAEPLTQTRISELPQRHEPFAIILGCSDSRVPAEIIGKFRFR